MNKKIIILIATLLVMACDDAPEQKAAAPVDSTTVQTPIDTSTKSITSIDSSNDLIRLVAVPLGHKMEVVKDPQNNVVCYVIENHDITLSCLQIKP